MVEIYENFTIFYQMAFSYSVYNSSTRSFEECQDPIEQLKRQRSFDGVASDVEKSFNPTMTSFPKDPEDELSRAFFKDYDFREADREEELDQMIEQLAAAETMADIATTVLPGTTIQPTSPLYWQVSPESGILPTSLNAERTGPDTSKVRSYIPRIVDCKCI